MVVGRSACPAIAVTSCSPGSKRMVIGPWANLPINGRLVSLTCRRRILPMSLMTATSAPSWQIKAAFRLTPSFSFKTVAARPDNSWMSLRGSRLNRPSLVNRPRDLVSLALRSSGLGKGKRDTTSSPSRAVGRNRSRVPCCCPANSQRTSATRPFTVTANSRGGGWIGRLIRAGDGSSPIGTGSLRCSRPSSWGLTIFTWPSSWISSLESLGRASRAWRLCNSALGLWLAARSASRWSPPSTSRVRLGVAKRFFSWRSSWIRASSNWSRFSSSRVSRCLSLRRSSASLRRLSCSKPVSLRNGMASTASACRSLRSKCTIKLARALAASLASWIIAITCCSDARAVVRPSTTSSRSSVLRRAWLVRRMIVSSL